MDFGLEDVEFWDDPMKTSRELDDRLHDEGFRGLALAAPSHAPLDARSTLPVLVFQSDTFAELRQSNFQHFGVVVAVETRTSLAYAGKAVYLGDDYMPPTGVPGPPPVGTSSRLHVVELCDRARLPWGRGTYVVTAMVRDRASNRATVRIGPSSVADHDEEVERLLDEEWRRTAPRAVWPPVGAHYPYFGKLPVSPELPADPGIALSADRVTVFGEGSHAILVGSWRLPITPHEVLPPESASPPDWPLRPTALKRIALVVTGSGRADPAVLHLHVPTFDPVDPADPTRVATGHFAIDLLRTPGIASHIPQTNFIYAFSGEVMAGPVPAAFVSEAMLPPGAR